ncbi:MAG: HIT family protein [Pseudomonadota bacterium]
MSQKDANPAYDDQNIFAKIMRGEMPCEKVYEDDDTFVLLDIFPRAAGHCLVLPKAPARNILDVGESDLEAVARTTKRIAIAVKSAFDADGVSIIQSNEAAGNQEVFHMHVHVIPRHTGARMGSPATAMESVESLKKNGAKIRNALG